MHNFLNWMMGEGDFPARWSCGRWSPLHGWTHIISDLAIWGAYMAIPFVLIYFISRRRDFPFPRIFWFFGIFIASCGLVHLCEAIIFWVPIYRLSGSVKVVTAVVSWLTVFALIRVVPFFLTLRSPEELQSEIARRLEAERQLQEKNEELKSNIRQLESANKELDAFTYTVSHDLRAPLRAVDGFSRLLLEEYGEKLDEEGRRLLNVVRKNTISMGQLIDDLLAFSKLGRQEIKISPIDMEKLVREVCAGMQPALDGRAIELKVEAISPAIGDFSLIRQVFVNLIANAVKYTRHTPAAKIEIGSISKKDGAIYFVKDNGVGFDMQYVDKLFGVFQRLHSPGEFEGTGVGLAIVRRIIERHSGRVWAEGRVNEGAIFYFSLPTSTGGKNA